MSRAGGGDARTKVARLFALASSSRDLLKIEIALTRLGTTSITTSYRVLRDGELLVDGNLRHVLVDLKGLLEREPGTKTTIPDWIREGLAPLRFS